MPSNKIGGLERGEGLNRQLAQEAGTESVDVERGFQMNAEPRAAGFHNAGGKGPALRTRGRNKGSGG